MESIVVRMNEWFFTQGLIGYKRILERYGTHVKTTEDGIKIEREHLDLLTNAFFQFYFDEYSVANREERKIKHMHKKFKEGDKEAKKELNKNLNEIKKKVEKYFPESEEGIKLIQAAELYRKEKVYAPNMDNWLNIFIEMLQTTIIDQKLTLNFFKTVYLKPYFGQVSFLNVSNNSKSINEHKDIFYKDFILPVKEELELYFSLESNDEDRIKEVLEKIESKYLQSFVKKLKKKKSLEEIKTYLQEEIHQCSLTGFPIALYPFEEGVFVPLALSIGNAINMTWNSNGKNYLPISSLARLLIFCSQAGATMSQGKSIFVFYGGTFDEIYQTNQFYRHAKSRNKTFDEIIFDLIREQKLKADFIKKHYIIYEYTSEYQSKKTLMDYMIMTPTVAKLFLDHSNLFDHLHYLLKSEMVRLLLKGIDSKQFINQVLQNKVRHLYSTFDVIKLVQIRHLNQLYAKGEFNVDSNLQKKYVWALVKSAEEVRRKINNEKKAQGIAYRLLNAVRSNNKNSFMDTVMRTYISYDIEMPGLLLEALHENKMDFATVGNAWIAGLVSKSKKSDDLEGEKLNE